MRGASCESDCPVLDDEIGNQSEIPEISGEKRGRNRKGNGGNLEVHCPDSQSHRFESLELHRGAIIEVERCELAVIIQMSVQAAIDADLSSDGLCLGKQRKPASRLLFVCDDRRGDLFFGHRCQSRLEAACSLAPWFFQKS